MGFNRWFRFSTYRNLLFSAPVRRLHRGKQRLYRKLWIESLEDRIQPATVNWISASSGNWNTPGNWSTGALPQAGDVVIINQTGITVTHSAGTDSVQSITSNANLTLSGGTLSVSSNIQTASGAILLLEGGTLSSATILAGTGGSKVELSDSGGTLAGVTIAAGATLDATQNINGSPDYADVTGGLTLNGAANLGATGGSTYGRLYFVSGSQTLAGSGTVTFGSSTNNALYAQGDNGSNPVTLTIGSGITVQGGSGIIGGYYSNDSFVNNGVITIPSGQTLQLGGLNWVNNGAITANGATVNLNGAFTFATLGNFSASGGLVNLQGTLNNAGATLPLAPGIGAWRLLGGTINGGTVASTGGSVLALTDSSGTLAGVTIAAGATLDATQNINGSPDYADVTGGLTLNGTANLGAAGGSTYGQLYFVSGSQTLSGSGTVTFGNSPSNDLYAQGDDDSNPVTLTIGGGITIAGGSGNVLGYYSNDSVVNNGVITIPAGQALGLSGLNWVNNGTITANGATVNLYGTFTYAGLGNFSASGGLVNLRGTLNNAGATLPLAPAIGSWRLLAGTISGGTVASTGGSVLALTDSSGTLAGVTIAAGTTLDATQNINGSEDYANVTGGLTLNGAANLGAAGGSTYGQLYFVSGSQTLSGSGTVTFGNSPSNDLYAQGDDNSNPVTLTIGGGITIAGGSGNVLGYYSNDSVVNNGVITIPAGQALGLSGLNWVNNGTITANGATVNLYETFTYAGLGNFSASGGLVNLRGTLNNAGATLPLAPAIGSWRLLAGTISGGTVASTGGSVLALTDSGGTLAAVTIAAGSTLDATQNINGGEDYANVTGGLTLNGAANLGAAGGSTYGQLYFVSGSQTLAGNGTVTFGNNTSNALYAQGDNGSNPATLTIGSSITIAGGSGIIAGVYSNDSFVNNGVITIPGGQTLQLGGGANWVNAGTITANGATVNLYGMFTYAALGNFSASGGLVNLRGTLNNAGATLPLAPGIGAWRLLGGTINGGTVASTGGSVLALTDSGGTLAGGVTIAAGTTLDATQNINGGEDYASVTGGLTLNGAANLGATNGSTYGQLTFANGLQTLAGSGTLTFGSNTSNALYAQGDNGSNPATLTIGSSITIAGGSGIVNGYYANDSVVNNGVITIPSGQTLQLGGFNWVNNGTITANGATVNLYGAFTYAGLGNFSASGGLVNLYGTLNNTGATLPLAPGVGAWRLLGGTINGGTVASTGGSVLALTNSGGTLAGVAVAAGTTLDATQNINGGDDFVNVTGGLTLNGAANLGAAGGSTNGQLYFVSGNQTLSGSGTLTLGGSTSNALYARGNNGSNPVTLTIGGNINIQGGNGIVSGYYSNDSVVNNGAISVASGSTVNFGGLNAINSGLIGVAGGTLKAVGTSLTNAPGGLISGYGTLNTSGVTFVNNGITDLSPPSILNVVLQSTFVTITYYDPVALNAATVTNPANYTILGSGGDDIFGNGNDVNESGLISQITYNSTTQTATLQFSSALPVDFYRVEVNGSAVQDNSSTALYPGLVVVNRVPDLVAPTRTVSWTGGAGTLNWTDANNWSTLAVPGPLDAVTISTAVSGPISIASGAQYIYSLTDSTASIALSGGTLTVAGNLQISGGSVLTLKGGALANATVASGTTLVSTNSGGTLSGVTIAAGATLDATQNINGSPDYVYVTGGLKLNGAVNLGATNGSTYGNLDFLNGSQTLSGSGTVTLGSNASNLLIAYGYNTTATLTIGSGITVQGGSGTVGGYYSADSIVNNGVVTVASGQTLTVQGGNWINNGTITATGATVNLAGSFTTAGLGNFSASGGVVNLKGTLNNTGATLTLSPALGAWRLLGGTINGGTVASTGGSVLALTNSGGTLAGGTIAAGATLDATQNINGSPDYVYVTGGLKLNGAVNLGATNGSTYGNLDFLNGSQTLSGSGTVTLGSNASNLLIAYGYNTTATLTIGSGITVQGGSGTVGGYYSADSIVNNGVVTVASGQTLTVQGGNWINNGTITATGATVNLAGSFTTAGLGNFSASGGVVNLKGTLNNTGATLTLSPALGAWRLLGGTINGGTVASTGGSVLALTDSGGTLAGGVTIAAGTTLDATQNINGSEDYASVTGGLTLNGAANLGATNGSTYGQLNFVSGSQTLAGTGTVTFGSSTSNALYAQGNNGNNFVVLTIGSGIRVQGGSGIIAGYYSNDSFVNNAVVTIPGGQTLQLGGGANWVNAGAITANGATVNLYGTFTFAALGNFSASGGVVNLRGTLNNTGATLTLAPAIGAWRLLGGTISGGTVASTGGSVLALTDSGGTLAGGVTIAAGTTLDATQNINGGEDYASVTGGLTLNGAANLGATNGSTYGQLNFVSGSQTLAGTGTVTFGSSTSNALYAQGNNGNNFVVLTIGSGIRVQGGSGIIAGYYSNDSFVNNAVVTIPGGQTLQLGGGANWVNAGAITANGATVNLYGTFTVAALGNFSASGGVVNLRGTLNNTGATLALAPAIGAWRLLGGTIRGGTVASTGGSVLALSDSGGTLAGGVTIAAGTTLDATQNINGGEDYASVTGGLTLNGAANLGATNGSTYGQLNFVSGSQTLAGTGTVTFGSSTSNALYAQGNNGNNFVVLTIGSGIRVQGGSGIIAGYYSNDSFVNNAVVTIPGGQTLQLGGGANWVNAGAITANGATVNLYGTFTFAALGNFSASGGVVNLRGTLNNTGATLTLAPAIGAWRLLGGTISGGTVASTGGSVLALTDTGGTLAGGVTIAAGATLDATQNINGTEDYANVTGGLTLNGAANLGAAGGSTYSQLYFVTGSQTLAGSGTVTFGGSTSNALYADGNGGSNPVALTIGSGITVQGGSGIIGGENSGDTSANQGTITVASSRTLKLTGAFTNSGAITVGASSTLNASTSYTQSAGTTTLNGATLTAASPVTLNGGALTGSGTISGSVVNTGGQVAPGLPIGVLNITGNYTQNAGGALAIDVGGATAGTQYSQLHVTGAASLNGALNVNLTGGYTPASGNSFQILPYGSSNGDFATRTGFYVGAGLFFQEQFVAASLNLVVNLAHLSIQSTLANVTAGQTFAPLQVAVIDSNNNVVTSDNSDQVTLSINQGALLGTLTEPVVNGVATFANLSITQAAAGYQLTAAVSGFTSRTSNFFNVSPAAESQLVYLQQPISASFGFNISPTVKLALEDAYGNVETSDGSTQATLSFATNPTSAALTVAANPITASAGVVTFAGLSINKAGTGYQLQAQATGLPAAVSNAFNITAAATSTAAVSTSASTSTSNQTVNLSASVSIPGSSTVVNEGAVTFTILNGGTPIGSAVVANVVNGVASSTSYVLPGGTPTGTYTIQAAYANGPDVLGSSDTSHTLVVYSEPDLQVTGVSGPATGFTGQTVLVSWTDQNTGAGTATGPWVDNVYTATSANGNNPTLLGSFTFTGSLAPGASAQLTQQVALPQTAGTQWFMVTTNATQTVPEGTNYGNDTTVAAASISITPVPLPDLVVSSITPPPNGVFSGNSVPVSFVVKNQGQAATSASTWQDWVILSQDPNLAQTYQGQLNATGPGGDQTLNNQPIVLGFSNPSYLGVGQSYQQNVNVPLPISAQGVWYVYVVPDGTGAHHPFAMAEASRTDKLAISAGFSVALSPTPDLAVSGVQAPAQDFSGQPMKVSWTVSNIGQGPTVASAWTDAVYMSPTATLGSNATLLATFPHQGVLASGGSYTSNQTVTLPVGVSGSFYFLVKTDLNGLVFENGATANNVAATSAAETVNLTPPPALTVSSITTPATALAGHGLTFSYTVTNSGAGPTPNYTWNDALYLSPTPTFQAGTAISLGQQNHQGSLAAGAGYTNTVTATLPNGLAGSYYMVVSTDSGSVVFELNRTNGLLVSTHAITVTAAPPDLVVSSASAPAAALPGSAILVNWTVANQSTGDTAVTAWQDSVYIDTGATLSSQAVLLGTFEHYGLVSGGSSYSQTQLLTLPINLLGNYNLFVVTNSADDVYESNTSNNTSGALPISISLQLSGGGGGGGGGSGVQQALVSDLQPTAVTGPATVVSGGNVTVNWTVKNIGSGATNAAWWNDDVWMSTNATLGSGGTDVYLGTVQHNNYLASGASYSTAGTFALPSTMTAGHYYFIVAVDRPVAPPGAYEGVNLVYESNETNNDLAASSTTAVSVGATPNLTVSNVTAPVTATAGQQLAVGWTVTNNGAATGTVPITDSVYLSYDNVLDSTDRYLGSVTYQGGLATGASYTQNASIALPAGLTGTFYVFVVTNSDMSIFEQNPSNNNAYDSQTVQIQLAPAADLAAGTVAITAPATPLAGQNVTISYHVTNTGGQAANGSWSDALYLSPTQTWSASDPLLGVVSQTQNLLPGGSYTGTLTAPLPGVAPGSYYVILRTNILDNLAEQTLSNNLSVSSTQTAIDAPALTLGQPTNGTLNQGQSAYYKVVVSAGQTLQVVLTGNQAAHNELYVSFGTMPTRSTYDYRYSQSFAANQQITIPTTQAGAYYILAYGNDVPSAPESYSITAAVVPFSIQTATPGQAGAGPVTLQISGAQFAFSTTFQLRNAQGTVNATRTLLQDSATAFATFNLTGSPLGSYDVWAVQSNGTNTHLSAGLNVVAATPQNSVQIELIPPQAVLVGRPGTVTVSYSNPGNTDLPAPLILLNGANALFQAPGQSGYTSATLQLIGFNPDGPFGTLPPGFQGSITIPFTPVTAGVGLLSTFTLQTLQNPSEPFDWNAFAANDVPLNTSPQQWSAMVSQAAPLLGGTWGAVVSFLDNNSVQLVKNAGGQTDPNALNSLYNFDGLLQYVVGVYGATSPAATPSFPVAATEGEVTLYNANGIAAPPNSSYPTFVLIPGLSGYQADYGNLAAAIAADSASYPNGHVNVLVAVWQGATDGPTIAGVNVPWIAALHVDTDGGELGDLLTTLQQQGEISLASTTLVSQGLGNDVGNEAAKIAGGLGNALALNPASALSGYLPSALTTWFQQSAAYETSSFLDTQLGLAASTQTLNTGDVNNPLLQHTFGVPWLTGQILAGNDSLLNPGNAAGTNALPPDNDPPPPSSPTGLTVSTAEVEQIISHDPNSIIGPKGSGTSNMVPVDEPLPYTIDFTNVPTAAPAQQIEINEQIDAPNLDEDTFRLTSFDFDGMTYPIPADSAYYQTTIDLTQQLGFEVEFTATIDESTGTATWIFTTIDPATGQVPQNPEVGLLPAQNTTFTLGSLSSSDSNDVGTGFVSYTIMPTASDATGTVVTAQAAVTFDTQPPLDTNEASNTIDAGAGLTSSVASLPAFETSQTFPVSWSGSDASNGSGVDYYSIYASDNGGPYTAWLENTTLTSAPYVGQNGHTYSFYSVAADNAGDVQATTGAAQATTEVDSTPPVTTGFSFPAPGGSYTASHWTGALAGSASDGVSGVQQEQVSILDGATNMYWNGSAFASTEDFFPATLANPGANSTTWSLSFPSSDFPADGSYTVHAEATNVAGDEEAAGLLATFNYDNTPPTTTDSLSGTPGSSGYRSAVTVTLTASDAVSGVAATYFTIDGGSQQTYSGSPFSVTGAGAHQITFWSVDAAGNTETVKSDNFTIEAVSLSLSTFAAAPSSVPAGGQSTITLTAVDANGSSVSGASVAFGLASGSAGGTFGAVTDHGNGTYTASFTVGTTPGSDTFTAAVYGQAVTSTAPTITVTPGPVSLSQSTISITPTTLQAGGTAVVTLTALDAYGNVEGGGLSVAFGLGAGIGGGTFSAVTDHGNGVYTAIFTASAAGAGRTITATIGGGAVASALPTIAVTPAAASQLVTITEPSTTATAGAAFAIQPVVAEEDAYGNIITSDSTSTVTAARDNLGTAALQGSNLTVTLSNGVAAFSGLSYNKAETMNIVFTTNAGGVASTTSSSIVVSPATASQLVVTTQPSSTATAGGAFVQQPVVVEEDQFGNILTSDSTHTVTAGRGSQGAASLQGSNLTVTLSNGVATFIGLSYNKAETMNLAFSTNAGAFTATSNNVVVSPGAVTHLSVSALSSSTTAGAGVGVVVTALDAYNNTTTDTGAVTFTSTDSQAGSPVSSPTTFSGSFAFAAATLKTATTTGWTITATAGTFTATSSAITVTAGAATHFVVTAPSSTLTLNSTSFTVTAYDQYNNVATGYSGTVHFTSSDAAVSSGSGLPIDSTLVSGAGTFTAALKTPGNKTITVADASNTGIVGNSNAILTHGLYVTNFATTPSGFTATFSKVVNPTAFDYYRFSASQAQAPDVAMATVGAGTTNVNGTLLVSSTATQTTITFVATQGVLTNAAKYTVTLTSGAGGIVDASGEPLAGDANGFSPGTNYVAANLVPASATTPTLSIPGFARGPNSSANVQITTNSVTAAGIPITLTHAPANTTEVQFTLDFNTALLNVTGPTSGNLQLLNPGTANSTGVANFKYSGPALNTTSAVLGNVVANVPSSAANEMLQKALLDLPVADIFFNGSGTSANPVQNGDGVQVVDYLGETTNNYGVINSNDASNAQAVVSANTTPTTANQPAGLQAFPLADPFLIAGSTGSTTFKVVPADVTGLSRFAVSLSHPFIPTPPTGLTYSSPGPDPTVSIPTNLQVTAGGTVSVPVNIDDPRPAGSSGMTQAELALTYDPAVFSLSSADVHLGAVPASGAGWMLTSEINPLTGEIAILLESLTPISSAAGGSLVTIDFHVRSGATVGATAINLVAEVNPTGNAVVWTRLFDTQQEFTLSPAPSNAASDAGMDGIVVVTPAAPLASAGKGEGGAGTNPATPAETGSGASDAPALLPELAAAVGPVVVPEEEEQRIAAPAVAALAEGETVHASTSAVRTASFVPEPVTFQVNAGTTTVSAADGPMFLFSNTTAPGALVHETRADQCFLDLLRGTTDPVGVRQDAFLHDLASQVTQARSEEDNLESTIMDNADADLVWLQGVGELPALAAGYGRCEAAANHVTPQGTVEAALDQYFAPPADDAEQMEDR